MTLEDFIESVTREAQDRTGMEDVCINNIALFYPDAFEEAVEYCEMVTTGEFYEYWDEEEEDAVVMSVSNKLERGD